MNIHHAILVIKCRNWFSTNHKKGMNRLTVSLSKSVSLPMVNSLFFLNLTVIENTVLSGCLAKILITQIGHKIDFLQILYVNCTLSGYFKNTFRLGSKCFLRQLTRGVPWWTKMEILLEQKCQFSITLVTPPNT